MIEVAHPLVMLAKGFAAQAVVYFGVVGLVFLVVWRWGQEKFRGARIQSRNRVDSKQLAFEIRHSVVVILIGTITATAIAILYASGHTRLTTDPASLGWPLIVVTFVGLVVLNDAWFYFWHRLLHRRWLFRYVHAVHHKSVDVNPFSSYSFHWIEGLILGGWALPVVVVVPIYLPMLGVLQVIGLTNNVMSHLGYELLPRGLLRIPVLRWMNTSTFHNLHHSSLNTNFGLTFRFWDRLLGTEHDNYESQFCERGAASDHAAASDSGRT